LKFKYVKKFNTNCYESLLRTYLSGSFPQYNYTNIIIMFFIVYVINILWKLSFLEIFMWTKNKIYLDLNLFLFINKEISFNWNVGNVRKCTFLENNGDIFLYNMSCHKPRDFLKTFTHNKCLKGEADIMTLLSRNFGKKKVVRNS